ncbi:MAG: DUF1549 domain-containing protein, partial [Planctomycetales bacterium]|nr:DUF1549 domain-containing protein [Planctomycetales bacterium]
MDTQRTILLILFLVASMNSYANERSVDVQTEVPDGLNPTTVIDFLIEAKWAELQIIPEPICSDETFVRRVYLDLVGRIPTLEERNAFLSGTHSNKRTELVDQLIGSQEFGRHFADVFDVVLMGRGSSRRMSERQQHGWRAYLEESFNANRPWDKMARDMTLARKDDDCDVRAGWFLYERQDNHQAIAESISPAFFGLRIECAQCHDHPLAGEIEQAHYWGLVSFFQRSKNENTQLGPRVSESATGAFNKFTNIAGESYETQLTFFASAIVPEARPSDGDDSAEQANQESEKSDESELYSPAGDEPRVPNFSRREKFVDEILLVHPMLAKAYVNRLWALLVGRGFVHPVDRMDSTHAPSHPRLLDWLANDLVASQFDTKRLVRSIVLSRAYQLSRSSDSKIQPETFSYGIEKPLTAESFLRSIHVALDSSKIEPDPGLLADFRDKFGDVFAEQFTANATQSLYLTNNSSFNATVERSPLIEQLR